MGLVLLLGYGILSLAAQAIVLREFLGLAQGNEIFLGLGLWAWLIWTGTRESGGRPFGLQLPGKPKIPSPTSDLAVINSAFNGNSDPGFTYLVGLVHRNGAHTYHPEFLVYPVERTILLFFRTFLSPNLPLASGRGRN